MRDVQTRRLPHASIWVANDQIGKMSATSDEIQSAADGTDIFDVTVFIENDKMTIRLLLVVFCALLIAGVSLVVISQQTWFPIPSFFVKSAGTLSGASLAAAGAVPFSQIRNRMEKIRILRKIRADHDALSAMGEPDHQDLLFLRDQIRKIYGIRLAA